MQFEKKYSHFLIISSALVYWEVLLRLTGGTGLLPYLLYPVLFAVGAGLFFACIASAFEEKVNRIVTSVLLFLLALLYIIECLVQKSFQFYISFGAIGQMANDVAGGYTGEVFRSILSGIPIIVGFFLPGILYLVWGKRFAVAEKCSRRTLAVKAGQAVLFTGIGILLAGSGNSADKYRGQFDFNAATQNFGLTAALQQDVYFAVFEQKSSDELVIVETVPMEEPEETETEVPKMPAEAEEETAVEEPAEELPVVYEKNEMDLPLDEISAATSDEDIIAMNEYVKSLTASSQNEYTGIFEGKNLILICAEAFSHGVIDPELTPTLYRLTHNGFYFSDYYQPSWNGSTSTGEYSMLMGIAPLRDIRTLPETQDHNLYFTMGNQLQRLGYTGNAFHNGGYEYYSRHLTHQNLGYDEYIALGSGLEDLARWWPGDWEMFDATLPTYIDQQPFSVYYMTGSGHFPYKADNGKSGQYIEYVREKVGDRYKNTTLYYLCYQMELEYGLASMVEQLEAAGIADDTVICITSDHYPYGLEPSSTYGNSDDYIEDLYGFDPKQDWEKDKNAWILWSGCLENEYRDLVCEVSEPTYSLDILPTLSNLFGLEYDSRLMVGRDVFSEEMPLVIWTNHSWVAEEGQYDGDTGTFYPNEGVQVSKYYIEQMNTIVSNKLSFSGKVHSYDYYGILFDEEQEED